MTVQLYFGAYNDSHNPAYWVYTHQSELANVALTVSQAIISGKRTVTVQQVAVRNHGDETLTNAVDVLLCGMAYGTFLPPDKDAQVQTALDLTGITVLTAPPATSITDRHWAIKWTNCSVACYSALSDTPSLMLAPGQVISWIIPKTAPYFVLAATIQCLSKGVAPQIPPTQDPCTGVYFGNF
jgi:hypothetical protein